MERSPGAAGSSGRRRALVTFDLEGSWGMPRQAPYDLAASVDRLLARLAEHEARAVFFAVGEIAHRQPGVITAIARAGHEIGLHGHRHERFAALDDAGLAAVDREMERDEVRIAELTGAPPRAFRAPWLLAPRFRDPRLERRLRARGYRWVSNCETRHPVELLRAGILGRVAPELLARRPRMVGGQAARAVHVLLNLRLLGLNAPAGTLAERLRWMDAGFAPFTRAGLLEVPVTAPLDCDVIGLPPPERDSSASALRYAGFALQCALDGHSGLPMFVFHDWITGSANRIGLLDLALGTLRERGYATLLTSELLECAHAVGA